MVYAIITPLNIGYLRFDFSYIYALSAEHPLAGEISEIPMYSYHISIPGRSIIVDAVAYDLEYITDSYRIAGYQPPPPLLEQLSARGIDPGQVSDVIITHAHTDHYGVLSYEINGRYQLSFPKAQHYLHASDWQPETFGDLEERTLRLVEYNGLLELTKGAVDIGNGLKLMPLPGESPGHQAMKVQDPVVGQIKYFAGDLYHHRIELSDKALDPEWVDSTEMQASKAEFTQRLADNGGIAYFTHLTGTFCVVERESGQLEWQEQ
jgi:glyoxylase-like metal-dependent hydrolase (beta-lactamase superfamily II)